MSYRNPKYINQSVQGSFDKLQNTINASVTQAKRVEKDQELKSEADTNRGILAASIQSQATITKNAESNVVGNQMSRGKVGDYFSSYPARAAEIAMEMAKTPKPENYGELQSELQWINSSPETMKGMLTNAQSFLNTKDMSDIDPNQNKDILLASQVFNGELGFTEENGFSYDFQKGEGNSIEMVFKGEGYIPPMKNGKANTDPNDLVSFPTDGYSMNSAGMEAMQVQDQSLIVSTPKMSKQINGALQGTNILAGAIYNDQGAYKSGGVFNKTLLGTETEEYTGADGKIVVLKLVDPDKVASAMNLELTQQVDSFIGPEGDNGQARSVWNMRIAKDSQATVFNEDLAKQAFPKLGDDTEALKAAWAKGSGIWNYKDDLGEEQKAVFNVMYRKFIVDDVVETMESNELVNQRIDLLLTEPTKTGNKG
jgi:hypothetical protein|tara:strand:+ start:824 stop:2101 length:1278 start_codon:yes stop_codon:yes gene_type:complete